MARGEVDCGSVCQRRRSRNLLSYGPHLTITLLPSFNPATNCVIDFLCIESSRIPDYVYSEGALIDRRLFLMVVRGSPQRPLEGARVVFLLSFGGFRSLDAAVVRETSGTIEVVWAEVDIEAAEGSRCNRVEEERTMFRPMLRVLSEET